MKRPIQLICSAYISFLEKFNRPIVSLVLFFFLFDTCFAQDSIFTTTGKTIICKIIKVDTSQIRFTIKRSDGYKNEGFIKKQNVIRYSLGPKIYKTNIKKKECDTCTTKKIKKDSIVHKTNVKSINRYNYRLCVGAGVSRFNHKFGEYRNIPTLGANISINNKNMLLLSLHFQYSTEIEILGPSPPESVWNLGLSFGKYIKKKQYFASISSGISILHFVQRGHIVEEQLFGDIYEKLIVYKIGIPITGQIFWTPTSFFGIGLNASININHKNTYYGSLLYFQFTI